MNSDKQSIQNQGGGQPKPYKPEDSNENQTNNGQGFPGSSAENNPNQNNSPNNPNQQPANIPSPPGSDSNDFNKNFSESKQSMPQKSGIGGGEDAMGGQGGNDQPPKDFTQNDIPESEDQPKKSNKKLFVVLLIIILALGAAVAVYFLFLAPSSQPAVTPPVDDEQPEEVVDDQTATSSDDEEMNEPDESDSEVPTVPTATSSDDEETPAESEEPETSEEIPSENHESLLSEPTDVSEVATLDSVSLENIQSSLDYDSTETPIFREVILSDSSDNLITFEELTSTFSPSVFTDDLTNQFNQDPTVVTYTDDSGTWIGLIASVNEEADLDSVKTQVANIEDNISEVQNFFISDPGTEGSWSDGGAGNVTSRYITFSSEGASFNYGWSGDNLIIGASYSTFQEIVNRL